jgi:4-amino-4-deoxy-L-arabinose transferase-like glycosyltransferase
VSITFHKRKAKQFPSVPLPQRTAALAAALAFVLVFSTMVISSHRDWSATWDEPTFLAAGYSYLKFGDYRLNPEHPPLAQMIMTLPLLRERVTADRNNPFWQASARFKDAQFFFAHNFVHGGQNDADAMLFGARSMTTVLAVLLGLLVMLWAWQLGGLNATVLAGCLFAFEPNIIAHAGLVTTDMPMALMFFASCYALWRCARALTWGNAVVAALCVGATFVTKFSAVVLVPTFLVLGLAQMLYCREWPIFIPRQKILTAARSKIVAWLALGMGIGIVTYAMIWAAYGFQYNAVYENGRWMPLQRVDRPPPATLTAKIVERLDANRLLPSAYSRGVLDVIYKNKIGHTAFFWGEISSKGWWLYFPFTFLVKTPIPMLLFFALALWVTARWRKTPARDLAFVIFPAAVFFLMSVWGRINIGHRHILPIYPLLFVWVGVSVAQWLPLRGDWVRRAVVAVLLAGSIASSLLVHPHYLAYFNELVGGPRNGYKFLVDSNLDWGQDLKFLKYWVERNEIHGINLAYFGTADPKYYRMNVLHLPGAPFFVPPERQQTIDLPGYVAVSATLLQGLYLPPGIPQDFYAPLMKRKPKKVIGHSIFVYWVEKPWWEMGE